MATTKQATCEQELGDEGGEGGGGGGEEGGGGGGGKGQWGSRKGTLRGVKC